MAYRSSAGSNTDYEHFGTPDMIATDPSIIMNGLDELDDGEERSFFVRALYDFNSTESSSLSFKKGTLIEVLTQLESGWWDGLLGNDTRGWFPSNYVERITDAEAEAELQAQHDFADLTREDEQSDLMRGRLSHGTIIEDNADDDENDLNNFKQQQEEAAMHEALQRNPAKSVGAQYSGLGLGQDFSALRRLMDGVSSNDEGFDAFEQLAEATMTSNAAAAGRDTREDRLGVIDARRRSRMSDQSSALGSFLTSNGTANSNHSQSDISSMVTRSNAASLSDADNSRKIALIAAESASRAGQNALMDSLEKERIRAHTVSGPEGQQQDPHLAALLAGRPRAQTANAGMPSTSSTNSSSGSQTIPSRKGSKMSDSNEADSFWIPKVNEQGEIFYFNTQTGQQARDLPEGAESQEKEEYLDETMASTSRYGSRTDSKLSRRAAPSSETSDSRPTSSSSLHTAATRHSRMNTIEKIPDSSQVPYPWIVRTSDDDRTFHFFNRQTHEVSHDIESILPSSSSSVTNEDNNTIRSMNRKDTVSRYARNNSIAQGSTKRPTDLLRYRNEDEADTLTFQSALLANDSFVELRQMIDETGDAIAVLASMASEEIGEDGLSEQDERALKEEQNSLKDESRLSVAIGNVVQRICDLLRAAGALNISPIDLINASESIHIIHDGQNAADALNGFQNSVHLLQGRMLSLNETQDTDPFVSSAIFAATPAAPPTLLPLGKKINATLSKLVLSARSVVEQSCLNAMERPSFTQPQLEKILSYRHRIKDDSMELARALGIFSNEVMHSRSISRNNSTSQNPNAYLKSGKANNGIGLNVFGGGSAAGWRGNGFVLPTATEAAVLRAKTQMSGMQLSDMTKEAKEAFSTGSIALRRKPTQDLSRETIEEVIASKFSQHADILSDLSSCLSADEEDSEISAQTISVLTLKVLRRFGALISWIEELNLASFLDVDGPNAEDVRASAEEVEEYAKHVHNARQTLHTYGNVKQAAYDACQMWFLCVQDRTSDSMVLPDDRRVFFVDEEVLEFVDMLGSSVVQLQGNLAELLRISEEQAKYEFNAIGARAKVHGIDEVKMKMLEDKHEPPSRPVGLPSQHASSYSSSSTALAVPNGASSTSSSTVAPSVSATVPAVAPIPESKATTSVPPSSLKAMFQRARSTSVATGNSAASNDSSRLPGHDDAEGTKGFSRLRRDTVDGVSSAGAPSAPGSSTGDHGTDTASSKQAEEVPWFLQPDSPPEDIMLNPNGQVKGATLAALMERLTMHNAFDSSFNSTFLMTYRSFTTTEILLDLLFARFRIQEPPGLTLDEHEMWIEKKQRPIRFRVFNVLKSWLESHFHEDEDEDHMKRIRAFALDEMAHSPAMNMPANLLLRIIERRSGTGEQMKITMVMPASAPPPILPKNFRKIKFLDIDPLEMARQLTLMDSRLYNRIRPSECLGKAWSRDSGVWKAKGVRDVIGANNRVSGWVSEAILVQEDVKKRAAWVKHFVAIADRCFYLNNFSSMMAIYSGLNNASLNRLRRTWDAVNQRHLQLFENMRGILAPTRNFTKYRETLRKLNPPCVPFLGVYLTDLTFIEDGNTDRLRTDDRLINFSKRQMTAEKIQEIMIYQSTPYNLTPVPGLQKFIEENLIEARSDDELFEQSLRLEPREREDEKIARLLQESGFL
ncbi:hypothetical protein L7F22_038965 [Adiantum nelumboides]|nr:hypothetical protein [Adiantum nelumboides]